MDYNLFVGNELRGRSRPTTTGIRRPANTRLSYCLLLHKIF
jgi:hypothetical protein